VLALAEVDGSRLVGMEMVLAAAQVAAQGAVLEAADVGAPVLGVVAAQRLLAGLGAALQSAGLAAQVVVGLAVAGALVLGFLAAQLAAVQGLVLPVLAVLAVGVVALAAHVSACMAGLQRALMHQRWGPCTGIHLKQCKTFTCQKVIDCTSISLCNSAAAISSHYLFMCATIKSLSASKSRSCCQQHCSITKFTLFHRTRCQIAYNFLPEAPSGSIANIYRQTIVPFACIVI
jgi:hypothetical protein